MTPDQRVVIEEAVGRRIAYPPGALAWAALRKVLEDFLENEDATKHKHWFVGVGLEHHRCRCGEERHGMLVQQDDAGVWHG